MVDSPAKLDIRIDAQAPLRAKILIALGEWCINRAIKVIHNNVKVTIDADKSTK